MPVIVDGEADREFRSRARAMGLDPDNRWIGGYVEYEWNHGRHFIAAYAPALKNTKILEYGCNVGATATVLALAGADVTAADVDDRWIELATMNARRHGMQQPRFIHIEPNKDLPFNNESFDIITCNSVLEYVAPASVARTLHELNRVLKPGGLLLVLGTSNRLWPREVHSRVWLINYVPRWVDRVLGRAVPRQRGISPRSITAALPGYRDLALADRGRAYLLAHRKAAMSPAKLHVLSALAVLSAAIGFSVGMIMPSAFLALRKPA